MLKQISTKFTFHDVGGIITTADSVYFISNTKKWTRMFTVSNGIYFRYPPKGDGLSWNSDKDKFISIKTDTYINFVLQKLPN